MKRIISLFLIIAVFFSPSGCSDNNATSKVTPEEVKTRVISEATAYLKENYPNDEFTYLEGRSPNWAYSYYELGFTSKNYDNQKVTVFAESTNEKNDKGSTKYNYSDDYYQYYMLEDAEKYFYDIAKEYFDDDIIVKVGFATGIGFADDIPCNMTFSEFISKKAGSLFVSFFYSKDYKSKNIDMFINTIKNECNMLCSFGKIKNGKEEYIKNNKLSTIKGNASNCYDNEATYVIDSNGNIT